MSDEKPWILSKKEATLNLIKGMSKYKADLNENYYKEALEIYAKVREAGFDFDDLNPKAFRTQKDFINVIFSRLKNLYLTADRSVAKRAAKALFYFDGKHL